jgi:hypothetical protein
VVAARCNSSLNNTQHASRLAGNASNLVQASTRF